MTGTIASAQTAPDSPPASVDAVAESYARLALAMGQHDADYVDAFYGPAEWKTAAEKEKKPLDAIREEAMDLFSALAQRPVPRVDLENLRLQYLMAQLAALEARVRIVQGAKLKFNEESQALYSAVAPTHTESDFQKVLDQLDKKLPGKGPLAARYEEWRKRFIIPKEKLDAVFQLAIKACRERTLAHVSLPPEENFTVEYVTGKSWGGYNWWDPLESTCRHASLSIL